MKNSKWVCTLVSFILAPLAPLEAAVTVTNTSANFSIGFGFTNVFMPWNDSETSGSNTSTTQGGFTFVPTVTSSLFSGTGPTFVGRVLGNGAGANEGASGDSIDWTATITASWTGGTPLDAEPDPNFRIQLNITSLRIWGHAHFAFPSGTTMAFSETTPGNAGSSPSITLNVAPTTTALTNAANYTQLVWDAGSYQVTGTNMTRTFVITPGGAGTDRALDGFEVFGNVLLLYDIPEPTALTLALAGIGLAVVRRRRGGR
jgi:hypothetical protein